MTNSVKDKLKCLTSCRSYYQGYCTCLSFYYFYNLFSLRRPMQVMLLIFWPNLGSPRGFLHLVFGQCKIVLMIKHYLNWTTLFMILDASKQTLLWWNPNSHIPLALIHKNSLPYLADLFSSQSWSDEWIFGILGRPFSSRVAQFHRIIVVWLVNLFTAKSQ